MNLIVLTPLLAYAAIATWYIVGKYYMKRQQSALDHVFFDKRGPRCDEPGSIQSPLSVHVDPEALEPAVCMLLAEFRQRSKAGKVFDIGPLLLGYCFQVCSSQLPDQLIKATTLDHTKALVLQRCIYSLSRNRPQQNQIRREVEHKFQRRNDAIREELKGCIAMQYFISSAIIELMYETGAIERDKYCDIVQESPLDYALELYIFLSYTIGRIVQTFCIETTLEEKGSVALVGKGRATKPVYVIFNDVQ